MPFLTCLVLVLEWAKRTNTRNAKLLEELVGCQVMMPIFPHTVSARNLGTLAVLIALAFGLFSANNVSYH